MLSPCAALRGNSAKHLTAQREILPLHFVQGCGSLRSGWQATRDYYRSWSLKFLIGAGRDKPAPTESRISLLKIILCTNRELTNRRAKKRHRLADGNRSVHICHWYLAIYTGAKVLAIESPGAAYFMASKLSRPHEAIEGGAAYPQVVHSFFESQKNVILDHLHNHVILSSCTKLGFGALDAKNKC